MLFELVEYREAKQGSLDGVTRRFEIGMLHIPASSRKIFSSNMVM